MAPSDEHAPPPPAPRRPLFGKRLRRLGLAWENALEIARAGRLTAPYGAPYSVLHSESVYRLRRYQRPQDAASAPLAEPLLLVPPLMVASEVYDISGELSAVALLGRLGVDVWLVDFGAPEREEGGMERTLDDHVRAVSDAVERVAAHTGRAVHLAGYSQGGMFCYQAAALRRSANVASIITMGSPVDLHRTVGVGEELAERLAASARSALAWPLARIEGLPGVLTSTGFRLLSARKEVAQLVDFVRNLHDRQALEKREAKRLFLGGQGFVAWPGPAFRKFVDELVVGNRLASGGFVIDGKTVTLADLTCPILTFVGDRDQMGRPAAVRAIRRASPHAEVIYEVSLPAGHFGIVVGSAARSVTWPTVVEWMRWRAGEGPAPRAAVDAREAARRRRELRPEAPAAHGHEASDDADAAALGGVEVDLELIKDVASKVARSFVERVGDATTDLSSYLEHLRFSVPRINKLRNLTDDSVISLGATLEEQARQIPERTFFLWRGRAFSYADANRRVDAVVRGLIASGVRAGQRVGVVMSSRPSHLSAVAALSRLGAIAVLMSPRTSDAMLPRVLDLAEVDIIIVDPESAAQLHAAFRGRLLVLGGAGEATASAGPRVIPPGAVDLEQLDPEAVRLPGWFRPNLGRARDLAMVFVSSGKGEPPRATRITNRRWAFSALGAAAAATLTARDTVYCCLPQHHPSGALVAVGSALVGGCRLALATTFEPPVFWDEVRRYGATVVYYAGEMCRRLVDAPSVANERNTPVRLFAGSGLRPDVWRRLVERFGPVGVLEMYASTEANAVLANAAGRKLGSVGRPLPGSPEVAVAAWSFDEDDFVRDAGGRLVAARVDEPGMLLARLDATRGSSDLAHIDPKRLLRDAFAAGDVWFVTGDFVRVDLDGDHWLYGRAGAVLQTARGAVSATRIEDAIYAASCVALCIAVGAQSPDGHEQPRCAVVLRPGRAIDLPALTDAITALPEHARPQRVRVVEELALTGGFRPLRGPVRELDFGDGPAVYRWDARAQRLAPTG